ncbi:hypothetical protein [Sphingomicrobium astaxanthinifaciens]|uniref:hypothetical protein n=1 Tax=Sphingomicrobium astaxanthinifaciens TaxID=1227949 RepID=UPI001FCC7958|nr:hypothetical protein [Sphingomicrobium astaxanthinifaciens]MCJ7420391.1 hypothetical protein [Sphingomicrobium astaxanthinifaciens]
MDHQEGPWLAQANESLHAATEISEWHTACLELANGCRQESQGDETRQFHRLCELASQRERLFGPHPFAIQYQDDIRGIISSPGEIVSFLLKKLESYSGYMISKALHGDAHVSIAPVGPAKETHFAAPTLSLALIGACGLILGERAAEPAV